MLCYDLNFINFAKATGLLSSEGRCLLKEKKNYLMRPNYDYVEKNIPQQQLLRNPKRKLGVIAMELSEILKPDVDQISHKSAC